MSSSNNRTINGYETIDGELVLSEITNSVLATDSDGLVYGINNYISNLTSDVQSQINTINTTLANKEDLLTAANKLDMAYVGSGNVSSDELDMNIGNTTFNIYNTFLSVTGSIDSLTQNKQNLFLNNISSTLTSNVANYNYYFRRNDTNGQNFYIGNSNTSTTATSNLYLSGPNTNSAFDISVGNGNTTLTHDNSGSFVFNSLTSQNMYFQFNGVIVTEPNCNQFWQLGFF